MRWRLSRDLLHVDGDRLDRTHIATRDQIDRVQLLEAICRLVGLLTGAVAEEGRLLHDDHHVAPALLAVARHVVRGRDDAPLARMQLDLVNVDALHVGKPRLACLDVEVLLEAVGDHLEAQLVADRVPVLDGLARGLVIGREQAAPSSGQRGPPSIRAGRRRAHGGRRWRRRRWRGLLLGPRATGQGGNEHSQPARTRCPRHKGHGCTAPRKPHLIF